MRVARPPTTRQVIDQALAHGFDAAGITTPDAIAEVPARLEAFLAAGRHGTMAWLADRAEQRGRPAALWPGVRSVVVVGQNYGPPQDPRAVLAHRTRGAISVYAQGRDYHDLVKGRLKRFAGWLGKATGAELKVFVDTAPVAEKPLAQAAGLGWQGRHTNVVSRGFGSWLFLGVLYSAAALEPTGAEADHCGSCRACLAACPTDAFPAPYELDARRCLSYLTIEHSGPIPAEFRASMGNRIYGCDDCLAACPWNKWAQLSHELQLRPRIELQWPELADLAQLDDAGFRQVFAQNAIKRIGRVRFVRNVALAIGNSGAPHLAATLLPLLDDPAPVVRGAAVWALARLAPAAFAVERQARTPREADATVLHEWSHPPQPAAGATVRAAPEAEGLGT
ncbi:tRNA epoxyqueuosine(34) reductase QueG [Zavarzinia sp. CC-PAN008]|uniref:tRNA epoxyqueuosine(34) reductase QueG n=1 Tax=Zavarzinia sp. CC-PAN008 TaxID=3243332 RepID=UPI003F742FD5